MTSLQVTKQALASRVVDKEETGRQFTEEELRSLFHFTPGKPADDIEQVRRNTLKGFTDFCLKAKARTRSSV